MAAYTADTMAEARRLRALGLTLQTISGRVKAPYTAVRNWTLDITPPNPAPNWGKQHCSPNRLPAPSPWVRQRYTAWLMKGGNDLWGWIAGYGPLEPAEIEAVLAARRLTEAVSESDLHL